MAIEEEKMQISIFDSIYEAAQLPEKEARAELSRILNSTTCIDVRDSTAMYTPASKLAAENLEHRSLIQ